MLDRLVAGLVAVGRGRGGCTRRRRGACTACAALRRSTSRPPAVRRSTRPAPRLERGSTCRRSAASAAVRSTMACCDDRSRRRRGIVSIRIGDSGQHVADVVEAVADVVGGEVLGGLEVDADQVADRVVVLGPVEPPDGDAARDRACAFLSARVEDAVDARTNASISLGGGPRPPLGRHLAGRGPSRSDVLPDLAVLEDRRSSRKTCRARSAFFTSRRGSGRSASGGTGRSSSARRSPAGPPAPPRLRGCACRVTQAEAETDQEHETDQITHSVNASGGWRNGRRRAGRPTVRRDD